MSQCKRKDVEQLEKRVYAQKRCVAATQMQKNVKNRRKTSTCAEKLVQTFEAVGKGSNAIERS